MVPRINNIVVNCTNFGRNVVWNLWRFDLLRQRLPWHNDIMVTLSVVWGLGIVKYCDIDRADPPIQSPHLAGTAHTEPTPLKKSVRAIKYGGEKKRVHHQNKLSRAVDTEPPSGTSCRAVNVSFPWPAPCGQQCVAAAWRQVSNGLYRYTVTTVN